MVICWDGGKSQHRVALDPAYKGQRNPSPEFEEVKEGAYDLAKTFLTLANVHHVEVRGYEADDLIAHYWRQHRPLDDPLVILSSDKDFLQLLVQGQVTQVRLGSYDTPTDRWTYDRVVNEFHSDPRGLAAAMALAGDSSDNIPGVPRFGMKTAIKTLSKYGFDLDMAMRHDERLQPHVERIRLNFKLVDLRNIPGSLSLGALPPFQPTLPGHVMYGELLKFLTRYQMESVKSRLYDGSLWQSV